MNLEEARNFFAADKFATEATGCQIDEIGPNYAKCSLTLQPHHRNGMGNVMGGALFTLADFAFAVATNLGETWCVSTTCQINYLSSTKGNVLTAEAKCVKDGRSICFFEIEITDDAGKKIALVTASGMKMNK